MEKGEERTLPEGRRVRVLWVVETEVRLKSVGPIFPFRLVFDDECEQNFAGQLGAHTHQRLDAVMFDAGRPKITVDPVPGPEWPGRQVLPVRPDGAQHVLTFFESCLVFGISFHPLGMRLRLL